MIYVWLASWQSGLTREQRDGALARRAEWQFPDGLDVLGEYWPATGDPAVVAIFETDAFPAIMELDLEWGDVFDIVCVPACTPEQGLQWGAEILARRGA